MRCAGFVPDKDVTDTLIAEQSIIDRQHRAAGIAEHEFDSLPDKAFDQDVRAAALLAHFALSFVIRCALKRTDPAQQPPCRVVLSNVKTLP